MCDAKCATARSRSIAELDFNEQTGEVENGATQSSHLCFYHQAQARFKLIGLDYLRLYCVPFTFSITLFASAARAFDSSDELCAHILGPIGNTCNGVDRNKQIRPIKKV